ncbi:hypothetical protein [Enterococcus phage vB_EfaS_140]|uniref:Uncharacterized protein n=1 Tax=Enterococcus phage vB_EfaS_140 TaxID=2730536 RepID=A0ACA9ASD3_9CAUD|nr:hypothetical protein [Enterococcus phage vB_EfaS_140]
MSKSIKVVLPIPPSVNGYLYAKMIRVGGRMIGRLAETIESKEYKAHVINIIKKRMKEENWEAPKSGKFLNVKVDYFFPRKRMDPSNYVKIPYDAFTAAGLWNDDDMAKPQTGMVIIDKFDPRMEFTIYESEQIGIFHSEKDRNRFINKYSERMPKRSFNALMKKLDEGRLTEKVYLNKNMKVEIKNEFLKE